MSYRTFPLLGAAALGLACQLPIAQAQTAEDETDALGLEAPAMAPAPAKPVTPSARVPGQAPAANTAAPAAASAGAEAPSGAHRPDVRLLLEAAGSRLNYRDADSETGHRLTADLRGSWRLAPEWRAHLSNRYDHVKPDADGGSGGTNSLRELYAAWSAADGSGSAEIGRVNLRQGTAWGWNPTDFLRTDAERLQISPDPIARRDSRLGTAVLRVQRPWRDGSWSLAWAPKLADAPSDRRWSADLGSTNARHALLATADVRWSSRVSGQFSGYVRDGRAAQLGLSASALAGPATTVHGEAAWGRDTDMAARFGLNAQRERRQALRAVAGLSHTLPAGTQVTFEGHYNGFAPAGAGWRDAVRQSSTTTQVLPYLSVSDARQDPATREALFAYVTHKDLGLRGLSLTGLVKYTVADHSRLGWVELRYEQGDWSTALQWLQTAGRRDSEYGIVPLHRSVQLVGGLHF
ncbi:hypothetical protein [Pseudaquabacterium rugosum]|uniref:Alginate export domain-containing protein n=1 Tax=Pseudaquabacterium rugosum TaxID=2984194 RepID=A0ABU9B3D2_9BURK